MNEHHYHECGCACGHEHHEEKATRTDWIRLIGTVVMGIAAVLVSDPTSSVVLWGASYLFVGRHIIVSAVRDLLRRRPFTENLLMTIASLSAFGIGEHLEAIAVLLFYQIGEMLQGLAVGRSRASVKALLDIRPDRVYIDGRGCVVQEEVKPGDIAIVKPGERVPIDGTVISGETTVDTSALTGESLPRSVSVGDDVIGGFINLNGMIYVRASGTAADSTLSRILHIVEESEKRKAKAQNFISRFASWYTPIVMVVALLAALIPILFLGYHIEHIYRAAVLLTISCPCALVISIPVGYFGGIGGASRHGILFKGANYLEQMGRVSTVIMDKTGTLTSGSFSIREVRPADDTDRQEVMAVCSALEQNSNHPIAQAIKRENYAFNYTVQQMTEVAGYGVMALLDGKPAMAGSANFLRQNSIRVPDIDTAHTVIYVAWDGQYLGAILVGDAIKETTRSAIAQLRKLGVKQVIMLTGDRQSVAASVARDLGVDAFRAQLLPDEKVRAFEELAQDVTAFVGDGINDAPVLARADIGVAMGGLGSDAAIETADMVIMDDNLERLALAIRLSRRTRRLIIGNIALALSVKLAVMIFGLLGYMWLWLAILADTGVALIAVLNSVRALRVK